MAKKPETETTKVKQKFTFPLTTEDTAEKGREAAQHREELQALEEDLKQTKESFKGKIAMKQLALRTALRTIKSGKEEREVECDEIKDFGEVTVRYEYQGKVMRTRPMTEQERQVSLKLVPTKSGIGATAKSDDVKSVMREETSRKTKKDASTGASVRN